MKKKSEIRTVVLRNLTRSLHYKLTMAVEESACNERYAGDKTEGQFKSEALAIFQKLLLKEAAEITEQMFISK